MSENKTALYNLHKELGAKFVSFAGYEMPIQYSEGIVKEHTYTREFCTFFDVSHMGQYFLTSNQAIEKKLENIIPIDFSKLKLNQSKYSVLLNDDGGIIDDLIVTRLDKGLMIILNAACKHNDIQVIEKSLGSNIKGKLNNDLSLIAIQGPKAVEVLNKIIPGVENLKFMNGQPFQFQGQQIYVTRSGYTGEDGFELSIDNKLVNNLVNEFKKNSVKPAGLGARDTLRLEAGLCLYGHDLNEKINPIEANLLFAISKSKREAGGFKGWEKMKDLMNSGPKTLRVGIKPNGKIIAREGTKIYSQDNQEIGVVTSGTFGPSLNYPVAMGYVKKEFSAIGSKLMLEVRGKKHEAIVAELPFYKKSYVK